MNSQHSSMEPDYSLGTEATVRGFLGRIEIEVYSDGMPVPFGEPERLFFARHGEAAMYCDPRFVEAVAQGLRQRVLYIVARAGEEVVGVLPLVRMRSLLFGHFLVSLPYVSWAGAIARDGQVRRGLMDRAIALAEELGVRFLELRQTEAVTHPKLVPGSTNKVQMRLPLSPSREGNWRTLKSEVRTQIRKAGKQGLVVTWGGSELLEEFYSVLAQNMRDLGTPVYPQRLFSNLLSLEAPRAEIGTVRLNGQAIAACFVLHGPGLTEVPSAAALRAYRSTAANSLLYWEAIGRAIDLGQSIFDFGRSTPGSSTFVFKRKWGAEPKRVIWQYYLRKGSSQDLRPENAKFQAAIQVWRQLPVPLTRVIGPMIVRGIP